MEWGKILDSPNGKQEKCNHPRHPLPLPPNSSTNKTGQWKKGKLLAKGTFGHVYAGFNRYVITFTHLILHLSCIRKQRFKLYTLIA